MDDAALDQLRADGCEQGDDEGSGPEDKSGIDGAVAVERLQDLRDHGRGCEETEAEDEVEDVGDGEVAVLEHVEVDDGVRVVQLPEDCDGEAADADDEHPGDEGRAEPVVDLTAIEEDFECGGAEANQCNANAVDVELAAG